VTRGLARACKDTTRLARTPRRVRMSPDFYGDAGRRARAYAPDTDAGTTRI